MDHRDALHAVRDGWWVVLGCVLLGLAGASVLARSVTPVYESSVRLFVSSTDRTDIDASYQGVLYAQERSESYVLALRGEELAARVIDELDVRLPASRLADQVTAVVSPDTVVVEMTVADGSAEQAQEIAAAYADQFALWVAQEETPPGSAATRVVVTTIEAADLSSRPVSPDVALLLGLGAAVGLLLGLAVTVWGPLPWTRVISDADVRRLSGTPLIGVLLDHPGQDGAADGTGGPAIRGIRHNLGLLADGGTPRVVVVTGAVPSDGSATLARALAGDLARAGGTVVLIEADRHRAGVADLQTPTGSRGFFDVLAGAVTLSDVVQGEPGGQLSVVPPGRAPADPGQLLGSNRLRDLLHALRASGAVVIVDAPPVLTLPDASLLGALADGCLLAVRHRRTRRGRLADAADVLSGAGGHLLGVVLTGVRRPAGAGPSYCYRADADRGDLAVERRAVVPRV